VLHDAEGNGSGRSILILGPGKSDLRKRGLLDVYDKDFELHLLSLFATAGRIGIPSYFRVALASADRSFLASEMAAGATSGVRVGSVVAIGSHAQTQMILVDIHHFRAPALYLKGAGKSNVDVLGESHRAFPVTMVHLGEPDQRKETRRIDAIDQLFGADLDVVTEHVVDVWQAARHARQCPPD